MSEVWLDFTESFCGIENLGKLRAAVGVWGLFPDCGLGGHCI